MKKTLLVFLAIALVGTFAFAQEATISGSVSLTAGYDLDEEGVGFVNDSDIQIVLPILSAEAGASGDDGVYAEINITDIGWEWNYDEGGFYDTFDESDAVYADISATIYFNSLYMGLGNPDFEVQYVDVADGDYYVDANADAGNTGGFTLGFKNDMIDIALMVASEDDYRDFTDDVTDGDLDAGDANFFYNGDADDDDDETYVANSDANMVYGVMGTIMPAEGVSIPFKFMYDAANASGGDDVMAFGMAPSVAMGDLTFDMPVDYVSVSGGAADMSGFELYPAVSYAVMEGLSVSTSFLYGSYTDVWVAVSYVDTDGDGVADAPGAAVLEVINAVAEVTFGVADTEAFVPGLEWALDVTAWNLMDYTEADLDLMPVDVEFEASYMMGGMKPYMSTVYSLYDASMELGLGVMFDADFTGIDNTVITLDYANDAIVNDVVDDLALDTDDTESGRVTLMVEVSF